MKKVKAIIADDEAPLRAHLKSRLLEVWPELDLCGEASNGVEAREMISGLGPDIAFLDIRMPGLSGLEVAAAIHGECRVVFVTAYDRYAVDAFENEALDYLLKPVTVNRLERTVARLKKQINENSAPADFTGMMERIAQRIPREKKEPLRWIRIMKGESIRLIPVEDICYFKASDKYTSVVTGEGEYLIKKPIKELEEELDPSRFWRIHRGTIVHVDRIEKVSTSLTGRFVVKIRNQSDLLTVSRRYSHLFKQM